MKSKLIFNQFIARELIVKYGHKIIDLKKNRDRCGETVFVFEDDGTIMADVNKILNN